jgi:hypothetical protein
VKAVSNNVCVSVQIGITGEHGSDPLSITFFDRLQVDYVSCSPYRVPVAKVAAAQAHIEETASECADPCIPVRPSACILYVRVCCLYCVCAVRSKREREHRLVTPFAPFPMGPYMYAPIYLPPHYHHDKR